MRRTIALLVASAALAVAAALPAASSADPTGTCPDSFMPFPAQFAGQHVHDKNGDGIVCRKYEGMGPNGPMWIGGPDDNDPLSLDWADNTL
jgi:hypothetical protein